MPKGRFISYLRSQKLISKGCLFNLVRIKDFNSEGPSLQSILMVSEFLKAFPNDILGIPPDREI